MITLSSVTKKPAPSTADPLQYLSRMLERQCQEQLRQADDLAAEDICEVYYDRLCREMAVAA